MRADGALTPSLTRRPPLCYDEQNGQGGNAMERVHIEKLGVTVSRLGFGCMRFPTTSDGCIDEPRAAAMLDTAFEAGVNYFDTAYFYHNRTSEAFVGRALKAYPRDRYHLATKLPLALIKTLEEAKAIFEGQFVTMQQTYFDFYLLHALNRTRWRFAVESGILDFLIEQQRQGRIRHLGFSFHDDYDAFEEILTARDWDFCQIQLNYMDVDVQAGMKGYALCERLGVPVIVMEPVKGGSLATIGEALRAPFAALHPDWSPAAWAMRWVASLNNCKVILSGMSTEEQLADNLHTFDGCAPLNEAEQRAVGAVRDALRARTFVGCTACRYCMPCPFGVNIPENFAMMNDFARYTNEARLRFQWHDMDSGERAGACRGCGKCEAACPQALPIREKLREIAEKMEKKMERPA